MTGLTKMPVRLQFNEHIVFMIGIIKRDVVNVYNKDFFNLNISVKMTFRTTILTNATLETVMSMTVITEMMVQPCQANSTHIIFIHPHSVLSYHKL